METIENSLPEENDVNNSNNSVDGEIHPLPFVDETNGRQTNTNTDGVIQTEPASVVVVVVGPDLEQENNSTRSSDSRESTAGNSAISAIILFVCLLLYFSETKLS
jgi:hypothetical protein